MIAADPVETGIVSSLARPGGNITGVSLMSAVFVGKCVELFHDMLPVMRRVAVLTNAADALFAKLVLEHVEVAAHLSGIEVQPITLRGPDQELTNHNSGGDSHGRTRSDDRKAINRERPSGRH